MSLHAGPAIRERRDWRRLVLSLAVIFGLFHGSAVAFGSDRGQRGILVGAMVVAATVAADRLLLRHRGSVIRGLGLGRPKPLGLIAAAATSAILLVVGLLFARSQGLSATFYPGWISLLPGLFAQAGIAEEVLFRGYLFGHVRVGRTFWRAAALSMLPFVGVHLVMFFTMPWPIALAAVLLASVISFPLAYLFELGGNTIWPPALLHFVIQGAVKVVVFREGAESFALVWMIASAVVPLIVLTVRPQRA